MARGVPSSVQGVLAVVGPYAQVEAAVQSDSSVLNNPNVHAALALLKKSDSSVRTIIPGPSPVEVALYSLPTACSRYNTPSQAHSMATKLSGLYNCGQPTHVVLAVPDDHVLPSVAAAARSFPAYNQKTSGAASSVAHASQVTVYVPASVSDESLAAHQVLADSIRLAAGLVDMPCSELNTESFADIAQQVAQEVGASYTCISGTDLRDGGFGGLWG